MLLFVHAHTLMTIRQRASEGGYTTVGHSRSDLPCLHRMPVGGRPVTRPGHDVRILIPKCQVNMAHLWLFSVASTPVGGLGQWVTSVCLDTATRSLQV